MYVPSIHFSFSDTVSASTSTFKPSREAVPIFQPSMVITFITNFFYMATHFSTSQCGLEYKPRGMTSFCTGLRNGCLSTWLLRLRSSRQFSDQWVERSACYSAGVNIEVQRPSHHTSGAGGGNRLSYDLPNPLNAVSHDYAIGSYRSVGSHGLALL